MRRITLLSAFIMAWLITHPAAAETVQGSVGVGNRTIALPPGEWRKAAECLSANILNWLSHL